MQQYDVIVIGGGNGGLASAATLAEKGKRVILFERHNIPGGCGTSFRRGRFEFEIALHQLSPTFITPPAYCAAQMHLFISA